MLAEKIKSVEAALGRMIEEMEDGALSRKDASCIIRHARLELMDAYEIAHSLEHFTIAPDAAGPSH